jgi:hypothetical protein
LLVGGLVCQNDERVILSVSKKALLAWQIGDGRGHISKLRTIGESLKLHGFVCSAALTDLEHADELKDVTASIRRVSQLPYFHGLRAQAGYPPAATYGEFLGDVGFASTSIIAQHLTYWRDVLQAERPDVVIAEQAPTALLAARSLSIPSVALGTTYTLPPTNLKMFPVLLKEFTHRKWSESEMCEAISAAIDQFHLPPLHHLAELYTADVSLPVGIKLLDPYAHHRVEKRIPPNVGDRPLDKPWTRERNEVFAYLSTGNRFDAMTVDALAKLPVPLRVYVAGADQDSVSKLRAKGIRVEGKPVSPFQIARRSRVIFHAGSYGTMCLGIRAGVPQVTAPQQLEQLFNARSLERAGGGCCIEPNDGAIYFDRIVETYENVETRSRAVDLAIETGPEFLGKPGEMSSAQILRLVS